MAPYTHEPGRGARGIIPPAPRNAPLLNELDLRRTRLWTAGLLAALALCLLALSAALAPDALAAGAPESWLGLAPHSCPGCPLCGMSRAFSCATRADFARAWDLNHGVVIAYPLTLFFAVAGLVVVHRTLKRS